MDDADPPDLITKHYGRKEVEAAQAHFNAIQFRCAFCRYRQVTPLGDICAAWNTAINKDMANSTSCPKWRLMVDHDSYATHIQLRDDVVHMRSVFNDAKFQCADCMNCGRETPISNWKCGAWKCELTPQMEARNDCPRWEFDLDIPF